MFEPVYAVTVLAPFVLIYFYLWWTYKGPPHVTGAPIVGYVPFLGEQPYLKFQKLIKKHGPIFSLYFGSHYSVVLSNYDLIREAYIEKGNVFNSRPLYQAFKVYENETAFAYLDGEDWKVTRNFTMTTLKRMGFGKTFTKDFLQAQIQRFIVEMRSLKGKPVDVDEPLARNTNMLMLSLLTGKRCDRPNDARWMEDVSSTAASLMQAYSFDILGTLQWLREVPFVNKLAVRKRVRTLKERYWQLLEEEMECSKAEFSSSREPENFIHAWYLEQERRNKRDDPHKHLFSDFSLKSNLDIIIQASSDTSSTTLVWAFLYLIQHPDIQDKLHQEIDEHIGQSREPSSEDSVSMHYTRAFLVEAQRMASIVPIGTLHGNKVKGTIMGYEIPEGTTIFTDMWGINHDPKYFPEPFNFDPERFLDENRKFKTCEYLDPFSFGRRQCPGKPVAEIQIFLYLVSILKVFQLRPTPGSMPTDKAVFNNSFIRHPKPYEIIFSERTT